ncbi:CopG family ribbon-helix-helix protein [Ferrimonas pelagia]|uniref:Nickel-responsive transcriptional regulator NikR n=1 Tax=Ferrimonas pelagia TaxID=1177826 RepID=A0ABP9EC04_9GAMM
MAVERITLSMSADLLRLADELARQGQYNNRSELFRDLVREQSRQKELMHRPKILCIGTLTFLYRRSSNLVIGRISDVMQAQREWVIASTQIPVDDLQVMETLSLKGPADVLLQINNEVQTLSGVENCHLHLIPVMHDQPA